MIDERHEREQYFFDPATTERLADMLARYDHPCCLCAPTVGKVLRERGCRAAILDTDERFAGVPGFLKWDLYRPTHLPEAFGVILCDPPFFRVSLSQLFTAIRMLSRFDYRQPLFITYLARRTQALLGTFAPFGIRATDIELDYVTVQPIEKNRIVLFTNT